MTEGSSEPRKTRKELVSEWRHAEIREAARRIFARLGYAATNVEDIAKEAGMAKGTVYLYFKSKEEVFVSVLATDAESLTDKTIESLSGAETFYQQLTLFLELRLAYLQNNKDFLSIYFAEFGRKGTRSKLLAEVLEKPFQRATSFMKQCLDQAIARGELRDLPSEAAALAIFDLARGFAERHLRGWAELTMQDDLAFTHSLIWNGLKR